MNADARWFTDVIEPLADRFETSAVDEYVEIFTDVAARALPEFTASGLRERYSRIRRPRRFDNADPAHVFVLSRVTLGADVAITSVVLDAMKQRFPSARIWFVGPRKAYDLFAADPRIEHLAIPYERTGTLEQRLAASRSLAGMLEQPDSIVVDPDSRLSQLGVIPVCREEHYYFFESRGMEGPGSLVELTGSWLRDTFAVAAARPFIAPQAIQAEVDEITVSLGVGENPAKRVADPFERKLIELLAATRRRIVVDEGAGGEETRRVLGAIAGLPNVSTWRGAFAPFAARIAQSRLYVGYDSAGQHVAAACGTPLVSVFAGFPNHRFFERWHPSGPGPIHVIRVDSPDPEMALSDVQHSLQTLYA